MTSKIKVTFLGTASQIPTASRNHTSVLLTYNGENILVDCGEGIQRQFRKAGLNIGGGSYKGFVIEDQDLETAKSILPPEVQEKDITIRQGIFRKLYILSKDVEFKLSFDLKNNKPTVNHPAISEAVCFSVYNITPQNIRIKIPNIVVT